MEEIVSYNSPKSSKEILNHEYRNDFSTDYSWSETFLVTKPLWCVFISKLCCVFYTVLFLSLAPLYLKIQNTTKHNTLVYTRNLESENGNVDFRKLCSSKLIFFQTADRIACASLS